MPKKSVKKDVTEKNNERYAKIEELRKQIKDRGNERKEYMLKPKTKE